MSDDLDARSPDLYDRYREIVAERDSLRVALVEAERARDAMTAMAGAQLDISVKEQARADTAESRLVEAERQRDALIRTCEQTTFKVAHLPYWQEGWDAAMAAVLRVLNESVAGAGPVPEPRPETE